MKRRGQIEWDTLIPWIITVIVIVLVGFLFIVLYGKGNGAIAFLKGLFGRA